MSMKFEGNNNHFALTTRRAIEYLPTGPERRAPRGPGHLRKWGRHRQICCYPGQRPMAMQGRGHRRQTQLHAATRVRSALINATNIAFLNSETML